MALFCPTREVPQDVVREGTTKQVTGHEHGWNVRDGKAAPGQEGMDPRQRAAVCAGSQSRLDGPGRGAQLAKAA